MNVWTITGRLGHSPKLNQTRSGEPVLNVSIAVDKRRKVDGEWVKEALWVDVTLFGRRAESLAGLLFKGGLVCASGELGLRHYEARDGTHKTALELVARELDPLEFQPREGAAPGAPAPGASPQQRPTPQHRERSASDYRVQPPRQRNLEHYDYGPPPSDDDIPF